MNRCFGLSTNDTFKSRTVMATISSVTGAVLAWLARYLMKRAWLLSCLAGRSRAFRTSKQLRSATAAQKHNG